MTRFSALSSRAAIWFWRLRASRRRRLQLFDIGLVGPQRIVEHGDFGLELAGHVARLVLLDQSRAGEVFAVLRQGELRLFGPVGLKAVELGDVALHFLLVGDGARGAGADFYKRFLHFEDDHPDHLGRVVRLVEQVAEIGGEDIEGARENAHGANSGYA